MAQEAVAAQLAEAASMGPPLKAAENRGAPVVSPNVAARFNGAAAKSSGKCGALIAERHHDRGFNGAAAKSSGKSIHAAFVCPAEIVGFNGAAAKSSGKL